MKETREPTLYDLFEHTSLGNCRRMLAQGDIPSSEQLADVLAANAGDPLPQWFVDLLLNALRGQLKRRPGRPRRSQAMELASLGARAEYPAVHRWLVRRQSRLGLDGWSAVRNKHWWSGPPHERAAKIVIARWRLRISWRSFLNHFSSEK
ncbi:hypothetical protein [Bradyrhizobium sp.]|uniref:hypothetical protein n=1 Tax=Bradyrhizobium sp. TaxID=376 RepID=UPI0012E91D18|nr:hypothetical protein [Bradyrhizobium sp.]